MKKILLTLILFFTISMSILIILLSTLGIETSRFNSFISQKINKSHDNLSVNLLTIKFKLDIKEFSLFLETTNPSINYRKISIPTNNIKVYIDFLSLLKTDPKIEKINLTLKQIDINQLKDLSSVIKPSNLRSFINNKVKKGKIDLELEVFLDENNILDNFIAKGSVSSLKTEVIKNINLEKTKFNFIADKTDILIKNFYTEAEGFLIEDGDLKLQLLSEISLDSNFLTKINYNLNKSDHLNFLKKFNQTKNITNLEAQIKNSLKIKFDKTYKIKNYYYKNSGKIINTSLVFKEPIKNYLLQENIKKLTLNNSEIDTIYSSKKKSLNISGKYSLNDGNNVSFNLKNNFSQQSAIINISGDYDQSLTLGIINYEKPKNSLANFSVDLTKNKDVTIIDDFNYKEGKNQISLKEIKLDRNKILSIKKIDIKTKKNGRINNDFLILFDQKISLKGNTIDATNLPKFLNQKSNTNLLSDLNKEIDIDISNVLAPLSENLKNFKLIGKIEKGNFVKISSKGDFGNNKFLDISLKNDKNIEKKYLEIYSDLAKPLLTEFNFFKGLTDGKLLYTASIDKNSTISKLKIEDFKVVNAPGMVKLLSLADLGGLADLAEGEGISFDTLEIEMIRNKNKLVISEILALGPSISVLMEGYQDQSVTSLRGTLVPAKTLNKMISKIPLIGDIVIPKEVGEGLFGISFKMKGPQGKIKTTINPIRTLTPRFIQKIIDRKKNIK